MIERAVTAKRPRTRYRVTPSAHALHHAPAPPRRPRLGRARRPQLPEAVGAGEALREEPDEQCGRQADDVQVVALDPLDERRAAALDRVAARASLPLAVREVVRELARRQLAEGDAASTSCSTTSQPGVSRQRPETTTCVLPDSRSSIRSASAAFGRLAEDRAVERRRRCRRRARAGRPRRAATERALPRACSRTSSTGVGVRRVVLLVVRRDDVERDPELLEDRAPLRARRGEQDRRRRRASSPLPRLPDLLARPLLRPLGGDEVVVLVRLGVLGRVELDQSLDARSRLAQELEQSPCGELELDLAVVRPLDPVQPALRPLQLLVAPAVERGQSIESVELRRKTSSPPGRSSRAASGIHRYGSHQIEAPYSESARSNDASGSGTSSAFASIERELEPVLRCSRRAVSSCAGVTSTPTGRAPRRAATPRSTRCRSRARRRPCRRRRRARRARTPGSPQIPSRSRPARHARAGRARRVYSAFAFVQTRAVADARTREAQTSSSAANQSEISRSADSGESEPWTRLFGIDVAKSPRIVPGVGVRGIRRADRLPHRRDRALALDHERPRRRGGDEVDELAEERLLAVLGVVLLAELLADAEELAADDA